MDELPGDDLKALRVVVAGAGAVGSVLALRLVRAGAQVLLADPAPVGDNASGVAAGMLAPLLESLLDPAAADHYALMRQARDAWPVLAKSLPGAPAIDRSGALVRSPQPDRLMEQAQALGARLGAAPQIGLPFGETGHGAWLFTPEDWRLDPGAMLPALHRAFDAADGRRLAAVCTGFDAGFAAFEGAPSQAADVVVLATGYGADTWRGAGRHLSPIKGQILRFVGQGPFSGPVIRVPDAYLVPDPGGLVVGATMEEGRADRILDTKATSTLRHAAAALLPALAEAPFIASAGVRAATPDGLPLVGPAEQAGVMLARGARRNGWLLAPLIAEVIVEHLSGGPRSAAAMAFDPGRFG